MVRIGIQKIVCHIECMNIRSHRDYEIYGGGEDMFNEYKISDIRF